MQLILAIMLFNIMACKDVTSDYIQPEDPQDSVITPIFSIWQKPLLPDTALCICSNPIVYNGNVMASGYRFSTNGNSVFQMYNGADGSLIWTWENDLANGGAQINHTPYASCLVGNRLAFVTSANIMCINADNGTNIWSTNPIYAMEELYSFGNTLFQTYISSPLDWDSCSMMAADINSSSSSWDTTFTMHKKDGYMPSIPPASFEIGLNGDTIMYYQNRQYNFDAIDGRIDMYAFNLSADSIIWESTDIELDGNSAIYSPLIDGDYLYFKGSRNVFCFNKNTGEQVWKRGFATMEEDLLYSNLLIVDDKLIVKTSGRSIYGLNLLTGSIMWENQEAGATPTEIAALNNIIYYGSGGDGKLHAVSAETGEQLWAFLPPNRALVGNNASFYYAVAIDPVNYRLYVPDGFFLICYQLEH